MQQISSDIGQSFRAGALDAAVTAATQAVRKAPADAGSRILLAEMLVFAGNLQRADVVLDAAAAADPSASVVLAEFRQLLRAEMARRQFWLDGRMPEVLGTPGESERTMLSAILDWRSGDLDAAAQKADQAEALRPKLPVRIGDTTHADFRDADDLSAGMREVLTTTGKFYWLPFSRVETISFHPPQRPRDLAWRRAHVSVVDGPDGDVYLPVLYVEREPAGSDALRLGRTTEWSDAAPVRGSGQRVFLAGEEGLGIMDLTELNFRP
jgi:type VI secretion system protein ImpE